jgi:hypothetical protein
VSVLCAYKRLFAAGAVKMSESSFRSIVYPKIKYVKKTTGAQFAGMIYDAITEEGFKFLSNEPSKSVPAKPVKSTLRVFPDGVDPTKVC